MKLEQPIDYQKVADENKKIELDNEPIKFSPFANAAILSAALAGFGGTATAGPNDSYVDNIRNSTVAQVTPESVMNQLDLAIEKALSQKEGNEEVIPRSPDGKYKAQDLVNYLNHIKRRAQNTGKGVHFQEHENIRAIVETFDYLIANSNKNEVRYQGLVKDYESIWYYAHTNTKFNKLRMNAPGVKTSFYKWKNLDGSDRVTQIHQLPGEQLIKIPKPIAVHMLIDAGMGYAVLPSGTPIFKNALGQYYNAECGNLITQFLNVKCPEIVVAKPIPATANVPAELR